MCTRFTCMHPCAVAQPLLEMVEQKGHRGRTDITTHTSHAGIQIKIGNVTILTMLLKGVYTESIRVHGHHPCRQSFGVLQPVATLPVSVHRAGKLLAVPVLTQAFAQPSAMLAVLLERELDFLLAYFIEDHQLQDMTCMLLFFAEDVSQGCQPRTSLSLCSSQGRACWHRGGGTDYGIDADGFQCKCGVDGRRPFLAGNRSQLQ